MLLAFVHRNPLIRVHLNLVLQGISEPICSDEGTELTSINLNPRVATMNYSTHQYFNLDAADGDSSRPVDQTIQFGNLLKNNQQQIIDMSVQLNNCAAVNSLTDSKSMSNLSNNPNAKYPASAAFTAQVSLQVSVFKPNSTSVLLTKLFSVSASPKTTR